MKLNVLVLALAATAIGAVSAGAQAVIEERHDPAVVIEHDEPSDSVTIKEHGPKIGEKRVIKHETTGSGDCTTKTVHSEGIEGSKTVRKTNCD